jgi:hypothetical protein
MEHEHSRQAIARRLSGAPAFSYLRDWVDGAITTFAIVAGVVGAELSTRVVLILGIANLVADGFSMAASNYSGTKTEQEEHDHLRAVEERHIQVVPEGEREEIRQIFRGKGFRGRDLERAVDVITADRKRWIDTMLAEEYGLPRRCARRSRPPLAPSPRSCCAGRCRSCRSSSARRPASSSRSR